MPVPSQNIYSPIPAFAVATQKMLFVTSSICGRKKLLEPTILRYSHLLWTTCNNFFLSVFIWDLYIDFLLLKLSKWRWNFKLTFLKMFQVTTVIFHQRKSVCVELSSSPFFEHPPSAQGQIREVGRSFVLNCQFHKCEITHASSHLFNPKLGHKKPSEALYYYNVYTILYLRWTLPDHNTLPKSALSWYLPNYSLP